MSPTWIAEEQVVFVHSNGDRRPGRIAVGLPYQDPENASCPIALDGMEQCRPIHGETTLQALLLAIRFLGMRLHDFLSRGGRVVYADDNSGDDEVEVALDALFGALLRDAPPAASS